MNDEIQATIAQAVKFAVTAIWLSAGFNIAMLALALGTGGAEAGLFAVGAVLAVACSVIAFLTMQSEQIARLNERNLGSNHQRTADAWRLTGYLRVASILILLSSLICLGGGLVDLLGGSH